MNTLSTHVLDTAIGKPVPGIQIELSSQEGDKWPVISCNSTNTDGRVSQLLPGDQPLKEGTYKLKFLTTPYFEAQSKSSFYPYVEIVFYLGKDDAHYHVPLLISGWGYSTYRGS